MTGAPVDSVIAAVGGDFQIDKAAEPRDAQSPPMGEPGTVNVAPPPGPDVGSERVRELGQGAVQGMAEAAWLMRL